MMGKSRKLYWILTNACNLACRYCYYNTGILKKITGRSEVSETTRFINQFPDFFNEVVFTGGEALLVPEVFKLISQCKNKGLKVGILTNGTLLDKVNCQKLINLRVDSVSISLDSLSSEINDFLRGKTHLVLQGIKNMLAVKQKNTAIEIMQTITRRNISSIRPLVQFCQKNNINLWLNPAEISNDKPKLKELSLKSCSGKELIFLEKEVYYWSQMMKRNVLKEYVENCLLLIKDKKPKNISCPMGTLHFVLDVDGNMYPCFLRKDICLGNVYKEKIKTIIGNTKLRSHQPLLKSAKCVRLGCICMTIVGKY